MAKYKMAPNTFKQITINTQINCRLPSNLPLIISTNAIIGSKTMNPVNISRIISSCDPIIPKSVIYSDLMVRVMAYYRTNIKNFTYIMESGRIKPHCMMKYNLEWNGKIKKTSIQVNILTSNNQLLKCYYKTFVYSFYFLIKQFEPFLVLFPKSSF